MQSIVALQPPMHGEKERIRKFLWLASEQRKTLERHSKDKSTPKNYREIPAC